LRDAITVIIIISDMMVMDYTSIKLYIALEDMMVPEEEEK
jgi:hypothetical protein